MNLALAVGRLARGQFIPAQQATLMSQPCFEERFGQILENGFKPGRLLGKSRRQIFQG